MLAQLNRQENYNQAIELFAQGNTREAIALWETILESTTDSNLKATVNLNLTIAYVVQGQLELAQASYQEAQKYAQNGLRTELMTVEALLALAASNWERAIALYSTLDSQDLTILNNLIDSYEGRAKERKKQALAARWEENEEEEKNWLKLASEDQFKAEQLKKKGLQIASSEVSLGAARMFFRSQEIEKTVSIVKALPIDKESTLLLLEVAKINPDYFEQSKLRASKLNDSNVLALILQAEAKYYQKQANLTKALHLLNKANLTFTEEGLIHNWELYSTRARIYAQQGLRSQSISNYQLALERVSQIRFDIASGTRLNKEKLLEETDSLYKELIAILLTNPTQENLAQAIETLQLFHLAELETHFATPCEVTVNKINEPLKPESALIFNIVLYDSVHQIIRFQDGFKHKMIPLSEEKGNSLILSWRKSLEFDASNEFRPLAAKLYNLLIEGWSEEFKKRKIKNLTFINDSFLRKIPMAALWNGDSYLIENYVINYSLGLEFKKLPENPAQNPLIFASTKGSKWSPEKLPFVEEEVQKITSIMGGKSYLDEQFSPQELSRNLQQSQEFDILHLAGHARFSSFENSQLMTGVEPISLSQFDSLLRSRSANLQLLVLSGCQTATGNDLAILGMAGIGVRNGISSVLGGLWFASDRTTAIFMENFYQFLLSHKSPTALRNAQLELIKSPLWNHPRFWSNYILLN